MTETDRQLQRITAALLSDKGAAPIAFLRKARELEARLSELQAELERLEREQADQAVHHAPASAELWYELSDRALAMDVEAREQVRQSILSISRQIVVYMRGGMQDGRKRDDVDNVADFEDGTAPLLGELILYLLTKD